MRHRSREQHRSTSRAGAHTVYSFYKAYITGVAEARHITGLAVSSSATAPPGARLLLLIAMSIVSTAAVIVAASVVAVAAVEVVSRLQYTQLYGS
jgi:hypothetical protein